MQKINEVEIPVSKLPDKKYAEFRNWFWNSKDGGWNAQLEKDIADNRLANLASKATLNGKTSKTVLF